MTPPAAAPPATAPRALAAVALAALLLGAVLRLGALGAAPVSLDEVFTCFRAAGLSTVEAQEEARRGPRSAGELAAILRPGPSDGGPLHAARSIAVEEPHHGPLYFIAAWLWERAAPPVPEGQRLLTALAGLAGAVGLGLLARELAGGEARAGLVAAAVGALSPLFFAWSLTARPHLPGNALALWSCALLARALRPGAEARPPLARWGPYALSVAAMFYTFPDVLVVVAPQALLAALAPAPSERRRTFAAFAVAAGAALLACAPWIANLLANRQLVAGSWGWVGRGGGWPPPSESLRRLALDARLSPLDWSEAAARARLGTAAVAGAAIALGAPLLSRPAWTFAGALVASAVGSYALFDLVTGYHTIAVDRYLGPSVAGYDLLVSLAIAALLGAPDRARRALGWVSLAVVLGAGAVSCVAAARDGEPATHYPAREVRAAARAVEAHPSALVVCPETVGTMFGRTLAVANEVAPARRFHLVRAGGRAATDGAREVLVYGDAGAVEARLRAEGFARAPDPPEADRAPLALFTR